MKKTFKERIHKLMAEWKPLLDYLEQEDVRRAHRIKAKTHSKQLAHA